MIIIKDANGNILKKIDADISKNLLAQLTEAWVDIPAACYTGICGACMCEVEQGSENIEKNFSGQEGFPTDDSEVMTCIGGVKNKDQDIILKSMY